MKLNIKFLLKIKESKLEKYIKNKCKKNIINQYHKYPSIIGHLF